MRLPFSYQKLLNDQINIPAKLLRLYKSIGLDEKDVVVIIHILNLQKENELLPSFEQIANNMTINANEVSNVLKKLRNNGYLIIDQFNDDHDIVHEWYSISPLIEKLYNAEGNQDDTKEEGKLFSLFEQEFGRALSPMEIETISYWLDDDNFRPPLIKAALREAVLMGKLNFRYIDRILADWKKKGVKSVQDTKNVQQRRVYNHTSENKTERKRDSSVYYNWLEE